MSESNNLWEFHIQSCLTLECVQYGPKMFSQMIQTLLAKFWVSSSLVFVHATIIRFQLETWIAFFAWRWYIWFFGFKWYVCSTYLKSQNVLLKRMLVFLKILLLHSMLWQDLLWICPHPIIEFGPKIDKIKNKTDLKFIYKKWTSITNCMKKCAAV